MKRLLIFTALLLLAGGRVHDDSAELTRRHVRQTKWITQDVREAADQGDTAKVKKLTNYLDYKNRRFERQLKRALERQDD